MSELYGRAEEAPGRFECPGERMGKVLRLSEEGYVTKYHGIRYPLIEIKGTRYRVSSSPWSSSDKGRNGVYVYGADHGFTLRRLTAGELGYFWHHWNSGNARVIIVTGIESTMVEVLTL